MQKKILLKTAREYLQSSFPENLLPLRKLRQNDKKSTLQKIRNLKIQVIRAKNEVFKQYANFAKKNFYTVDLPGTARASCVEEKKQGLAFVSKDNFLLNNNVTFYNPKNFFVNPTFRNKSYFTSRETSNKNQQITAIPPFLFALDQIQHELSKRKVRSSDFKNQLKERKKLALIYGQLSKKYIKKTIKQASLLSGKKSDNFFFLLEKRLDIALFRACFFPSIKSARQWINHNKILVNNQFINTCSYTLKAGDIISIKQKDRIVLCKKITHFLKKQFFKENQTNTKQFVISMSLFQKLKSSLNVLGMTKSFISTLNKKNDFSKNLSNPFKQNKDKLETKFGKLASKVSTQPKLMTRSGVGVSSTNKLSYDYFLLEIKQILRFKLKEYSNNGKNVSSSLSQLEKNVLRLNLVCLDLIGREIPFLAEKSNNHEGKVSFLENTSLRGFLTHLKLKKLFSLNDKKIRNFPILHQNTFKPLHLEISYKNLVIIYLYSPQKIALPCSIDMGLIVRSLA
jgi:ribosomal protein S4